MRGGSFLSFPNLLHFLILFLFFSVAFTEKGVSFLLIYNCFKWFFCAIMPILVPRLGLSNVNLSR